MIAQPSLLDMIDLCANRSRGNKESAAAHEKVVSIKTQMHERIMRLAEVRKEYGITVHEVANAFGKTPNQVSGRLSELKMVGKLKESELTRRGARVLVAV